MEPIKINLGGVQKKEIAPTSVDSLRKMKSFLQSKKENAENAKEQRAIEEEINKITDVMSFPSDYAAVIVIGWEYVDWQNEAQKTQEAPDYSVAFASLPYFEAKIELEKKGTDWLKRELQQVANIPGLAGYATNIERVLKARAESRQVTEISGVDKIKRLSDVLRPIFLGEEKKWTSRYPNEVLNEVFADSQAINLIKLITSAKRALELLKKKVGSHYAGEINERLKYCDLAIQEIIEKPLAKSEEFLESIRRSFTAECKNACAAWKALSGFAPEGDLQAFSELFENQADTENAEVVVELNAEPQPEQLPKFYVITQPQKVKKESKDEEELEIAAIFDDIKKNTIKQQRIYRDEVSRHRKEKKRIVHETQTLSRGIKNIREDELEKIKNEAIEDRTNYQEAGNIELAGLENAKILLIQKEQTRRVGQIVKNTANLERSERMLNVPLAITGEEDVQYPNEIQRSALFTAKETRNLVFVENKQIFCEIPNTLITFTGKEFGVWDKQVFGALIKSAQGELLLGKTFAWRLIDILKIGKFSRPNPKYQKMLHESLKRLRQGVLEIGFLDERKMLFYDELIKYRLKEVKNLKEQTSLVAEIEFNHRINALLGTGFDKASLEVQARLLTRNNIAMILYGFYHSLGRDDHFHYYEDLQKIVGWQDSSLRSFKYKLVHQALPILKEEWEKDAGKNTFIIDTESNPSVLHITCKRASKKALPR